MYRNVKQTGNILNSQGVCGSVRALLRATRISSWYTYHGIHISPAKQRPQTAIVSVAAASAAVNEVRMRVVLLSPWHFYLCVPVRLRRAASPTAGGRFAGGCDRWSITMNTQHTHTRMKHLHVLCATVYGHDTRLFSATLRVCADEQAL